MPIKIQTNTRVMLRVIIEALFAILWWTSRAVYHRGQGTSESSSWWKNRHPWALLLSFLSLFAEIEEKKSARAGVVEYQGKMKQSEIEKKLVLGKNRIDDSRMRVDTQATHDRWPFDLQPLTIITHPLLQFSAQARDTRSVRVAIALTTSDPRVCHCRENAQSAHTAGG